MIFQSKESYFQQRKITRLLFGLSTTYADHKHLFLKLNSNKRQIYKKIAKKLSFFALKFNQLASFLINFTNHYPSSNNKLVFIDIAIAQYLPLKKKAVE